MFTEFSLPEFTLLERKMGFLAGSAVKNLPVNAGDKGSIPGLGRSPGGGHGDPLQYSCLEHPHGQRSLTGYSPRGHKESDTTKQLIQTCTVLADLQYCVSFRYTEK